MSNSKIFSFQAQSLRRLPDPVFPEEIQRYYAIVNTKDLPKNFPMDTNPRKQNLKTTVAQKILNSYAGSDYSQLFHLLNRGILISAEEVKFNNNTNEIKIIMTNFEHHGLVDGGHTYRIITENLEQLAESQFITLEIITGIEEDFENLAGARNTSVQVKDVSLAELEGNLDIIKELIKNEPFANDVAYVENEDKPIDVQEIIAILTIFNSNLHSSGSQPVFAYSSKASTLKQYLKNKESFKPFKGIVKEIFYLHDLIKKTMPDLYNGTGGKFGRLKEISYNEKKEKWPLYFMSKIKGDFQKLKYDIPTGFVYPILGAMRFLVEYDSTHDVYNWKKNPVEYYEKVVGEKLVELTMLASTDLGRNPQSVGKNSRHWEGLYNYVVATYYTSK